MTPFQRPPPGDESGVLVITNTIRDGADDHVGGAWEQVPRGVLVLGGVRNDPPVAD